MEGYPDNRRPTSYPIQMVQAYPAGQPVRPHRGTLVLVLGIVSLVLGTLGLVCCTWVVAAVFGIIAWILGNSDLREMDAGRMDPSGRALTLAGKICAIVGVIWAIVSFVVSMVAIIIVAATEADGSL